MDTLDALDRSFASTRAVVARITPEQMSLPTPCSEWDVRALLAHVITVIGGFEATAAKRPPSANGESPDLAEPLIAYDKATAATLAAWRTPGALEGETTLPIGAPMPAEAAAGINFVDCLVHGWDLQRALGRDADLDPDLAEHALRVSIAAGLERPRASGAFGPEVPVAEDASPTARLVGLLGRQP